MVIWSSNQQEKELSQGQYFCPNCGDFRSYKQKRLAKYFVFWDVPLFETQNLGEFVECQHCRKGFDPEVLASFHQIMFRLGAEFPDEHVQLTSPARIKAKLIEMGAPEDIADKIITMAQRRLDRTPIMPFQSVLVWALETLGA